jgi:hypothetical protein
MHKTRSKNLGRLSQFWKSSPEVRAHPSMRDHIARNVFFQQQGGGEFLWRRKRVGPNSDRQRRPLNRQAGCRLGDFPSSQECGPLLFRLETS